MKTGMVQQGYVYIGCRRIGSEYTRNFQSILLLKKLSSCFLISHLVAPVYSVQDDKEQGHLRRGIMSFVHMATSVLHECHRCRLQEELIRTGSIYGAHA